MLYGRTSALWEQPEDEIVTILALDEALAEDGGLVAALTGARTP